MNDNPKDSTQFDNKEQSMDRFEDEIVDIVPCSVLRSDQIERLVNEHGQLIIENYSGNQVRPASYDVRLGPEYYQNGKIQTLSEKNGEASWIRIKPLDMVYVSSLERLHLPQNIIGRYSLRLGRVYEGLVLAGGGAQVDPGYYGNLFGLLINFSNEDVLLEIEDHWATIEFSPTTYDPGLSKLYENQPKNYQGYTSLRSLFPKPIEVEAKKRQPVTSAMAEYQSDLERVQKELAAVESSYQTSFDERTVQIEKRFEDLVDRYRQDVEKTTRNRVRELESRINLYTLSLFGVLTLTLITLVILVVLK